MRIAQFGTFDVENFGDLLFPALLQAAIGNGIRVDAVSPIGGSAIWEDTPSSISPTEFAKQQHIYSALIIGGGNIIRAEPSLLPSYAQSGTGGLGHYSDLWLGAAQCARSGVPVIWNSPGVPEKLPSTLHDLVRRILDCSTYIAVRDDVSRNILLEASPSSEIHVVADPAWQIDELWTNSQLAKAYEVALARLGRTSPAQRTVVVHLNSRYLGAAPAAVAKYIDAIAFKLNATPLLVALGRCHGDNLTARTVSQYMEIPPLVIEAPRSICETTSLFRHAIAYVGSSMHGYIVASAFGVPSLCVAPAAVVKFKGIASLGEGHSVLLESWRDAADLAHTLDTPAARQRTLEVRARAKTLTNAHNERVRNLVHESKSELIFAQTTDAPIWHARVYSLSALHIKALADIHELKISQQQALDKLAHLESENRALSNSVRSLENSISWKITRPLRKFRVAFPRAADRLARAAISVRRKLQQLHFKLRSRRPSRATHRRLPAKYEWTPNNDILSQITAYKQSNLPRRVVVYTAIVGGYDRLFIPDNIEPDVDYVCFSDTSLDGFGVWDIRPIPFYHPDPTRRARYIKTHAPSLFPDHAIGIWIDANILFRGSLRPYIQTVIDGNYDIGLVPHPVRGCVYQEAEACIQLKKDDRAVIQQQMRKYRDIGFPSKKGMVETNFFVCALEHPILKTLMRAWWSEIDQNSKRDQLSIMYVLNATNTRWVQLMSQGKSCRNSSDFRLFPHEITRMIADPPILRAISQVRDLYGSSYFLRYKDRKLEVAREISADIIICVHNALEDVERCLDSVSKTLETNHRIIIVNDRSGDETTDYLRRWAKTNSVAELIENSENLGYTRSANRGLSEATADFRVLLNSDTIVSKNWLLKLIDAAYSDGNIGITGPLSNAASWQSIPYIRGAKGQTAINTMPDGLTFSEIDLLCEEWADGAPAAIVPLIHGFCFGIKRDVINAIGLFDDVNFEKFYGEENDYCFRARKHGFELAVATNTFVYHRKSRSIEEEERLIWMARASRRFRELHGSDAVALACKQMEDHPLLERMRRAAARAWENTSRRASRS